jgi:FOG: WD40 repeat
LFSKNNTLISSSKDGTVRAYDITKYKQFRVFTTQEQAEFNCVAADKSGEIVCAGSMNYQIYVWAIPTGILCEVLSGHVSPISSIFFLNNGSLVSGSWDKTIKV